MTHIRRKTRKATFSLDSGVLAAMDEAMARGMAPSKNALVQQALLLQAQGPDDEPVEGFQESVVGHAVSMNRIRRAGGLGREGP